MPNKPIHIHRGTAKIISVGEMSRKPLSIPDPLAELEMLRKKVVVYEKLKQSLTVMYGGLSCPLEAGLIQDCNCNCRDCWTTALAEAEGGE